MYIEKVIPWKSSKWEAPSAEEISRIRKEAGTHDEAHIEDAISSTSPPRDTMSGETQRGESDAGVEKKEA
jgi:hypothetical protein